MKKLVDENGKLFRKINLVDFIVLLLVVIVIVAIAWKAVSAGVTAARERAETAMNQEYEKSPHLVYKVICTDVPQEVAEACEAQMDLPMAERQLMSNAKPVEGYITACTSEPAEDGLYSLYFTIETLPVRKNDIYSVGSQEVRVGKSHIVKTYNIETTGWIYEMEEPANE